MEVPALGLILIVILAILGYFWIRKTPDIVAQECTQIVPPQSPDADEIVPSGASQDKHTAAQESTQLVSSRNSDTDAIIPSGVIQCEQTAHVTRIPGSTLLPEHFVFLDLETTGLSPDVDEIIEIGAIRFNRDQINHATFSTLVKPEKAVPRRITQITGITQRMVDDKGVPLAEALSGFVEFIGDLPIVTFNAEFDMGFIWNAAKQQGLTIENRYACALKLARRAWPGLPSYRLVDLAKMGNLSDNDTHRALGDCMRAVIVFASAVSAIGADIRWSTRPRDWREYAKYHAARDANRAFVAETRPLEVNDPAQAVSRYIEAMGSMYEYEKMIAGHWGDDHILDRLTLCLLRLGRYQELIEYVEYFKGRFPEVNSSIMAGILKRKAKAEGKLQPTNRLGS